MSGRICNIDTATYEVGESGRQKEAAFKFLDLSGEHLGVRIEEIPAGGTTSHHHYHTSEEEHVVLLHGAATLHLGQDRVELSAGDHTWFPAGEEVPHHIENTSDVPIRLLVFGERKEDDVVFYPKRSVVLVKSSAGLRSYGYEERRGGGDGKS